MGTGVTNISDKRNQPTEVNRAQGLTGSSFTDLIWEVDKERNSKLVGKQESRREKSLTLDVVCHLNEIGNLG